MTDLVCNVKSCAYNRGSLCSRNSIRVDGKNAVKRDQTACDSFECKGQSFTNAALDHSAEESTAVSCSACDCTFNHSGACGADRISVCSCGCEEPSVCADTECASFRRKRAERN